MDERDNPIVKFVTKLATHLFDRLIRGQIDYENDRKALEKYREMAQKANAPRLEASLVSHLGVLNGVAGRLALAEEFFTLSYKLYESIGFLSGMVTALNNLGYFSTSLGLYDKALGYYTQAQELCEADTTTIVNGYPQILSGQLTVHYMLQQYDKMPMIYDKIMAMQEAILSRNARVYTRLMTEVNRSMAEYHLYRQNDAEYQSFIRMGIEFAKGLGLTFELAELYYVQAHDALIKGNFENAELHWANARDVLHKAQSKSKEGRSYNQEARYLERRGYLEQGRRFAKYAYDIFASLNMSEDVQLTEVLLK